MGQSSGSRFAAGSPPRRVVSLVPSITETLFDLGAGATVVGVTDFCTFPLAGLEEIPRLGGTKNPDVERIRDLKPDLVHLNIEENLQRDADAIEKFATLFLSEPKSPSDVVALITALGALHGCERRAAAIVESLVDEIGREKVPSFSFACAIWKSPWMWCGGDTYAANLIEAVGGVNVLSNRDRYPRVRIEEVMALDPAVVLLPDEPWLFTADDAFALTSRGVRHVLGPFPGHLVTWHGSRTVLGMRYLREAIPKLMQ